MNNQRVGIDESAGGSVGLLMSVLVRYPEVSSMKYDPELKEVRFAFIVGRILPDSEFAAFWETLRASLDAYAYVTSREDFPLELERQVCDHFTVIEISRDVETLCQEEISLVISLAHEAFGQDLVIDDAEPIEEEDAEIQDGVIDQMLDNLKDSVNERRLYGFREEGRVMVFNRSIATPD